MKVEPGGIMWIEPRKPRITVDRVYRVAALRVRWMCLDAAGLVVLRGYGDTPDEAFDNYQRRNCFGQYARKAEDLPQAARSTFDPYEAASNERKAYTAQMKRFSSQYAFIAGFQLGFAAGLLLLWLVSP